MRLRWEKKGRLYVPDGTGYFKTHATRPIPYRLSPEVLRIYFSSRDADDVPSPNFIDVDVANPARVLAVNHEPLMSLGRPGTFDDSGITPVSMLDVGGRLLMYYSGWKRRRVHVTVEPSIGVCEIRRPEMRFQRLFDGPMLAQDRRHPILAAAPCVVNDEGRIRMWYCSGTEWRNGADGPEPIYRVHHAESEDGIEWMNFTGPVIDFKFDGEVISAPWVMKSRDGYLMWYSTRGSADRQAKNYTIGFAESQDGIRWERNDDAAGIGKSDSGWDSEMVCYPTLYAFRDMVYMFYSGNHVGRGGIGYAITENFLR